MYRIEVLDEADADMRKIGRNIAEQLKSPLSAKKLTDKIWNRIETFGNDPYVCQFYFPLEKLQKEYRRMLIDN